MAFPTIPTAAAGRLLSNHQDNTTATRTFPAMSGLTKNSGDLLIAICIAYQTGTGTNAAFSGWSDSFTEFHDTATSTTMAIGCAYKWSTGSETAAPTVTQAGTVTGWAAMFLLSIPGAHATTPPEAPERDSGTTAVANVAAVSPSWGAEDTLFIAVGGSGEDSTTGSYTGIGGAPGFYGDYAETGFTGDQVGVVEGALAFQQLNTSSENAQSFTSVDVSAARNAEILIAVRPAAANAATASAGNAAGAGAAYGATGKVTQPAGNASGTGAAYGASANLAQPAGPATGSGTAYGATANLTQPAGAASGTGTAFNATGATGENATAAAGAATGSGTAYGVAGNLAQPAGNAAGAGTAYGVAGNLAQPAGNAAGTGTAYGATANLTQPAGAAAGTGTAYGAAGGVDGTATAQPGPATGSGTAYGATANLTQPAGNAAGAGTAYGVAGVGGVVATAGVAAGSGAAYGPTPRVIATIGAAAGSGAAYGASVPSQAVPAGRWHAGTPTRPGRWAASASRVGRWHAGTPTRPGRWAASASRVGRWATAPTRPGRWRVGDPNAQPTTDGTDVYTSTYTTEYGDH